LSLDDVDPGGEGQNIDLLALDEAMKKLEQQSPRQHQVVMLRFFAGLKDAEIAEMLGVADKTVRRDWATARVWLYSEMSKGNE
jgi:RNA polymerase sigma factor (sigma-70 family)